MIDRLDPKTQSWLRENSTLVYFLLAQFIAIGAGAASVLAYMVKLETRVSTMETRGAEYTVARMDDMKLRIARAAAGNPAERSQHQAYHRRDDARAALVAAEPAGSTAVMALAEKNLEGLNKMSAHPARDPFEPGD